MQNLKKICILYAKKGEILENYVRLWATTNLADSFNGYLKFRVFPSFDALIFANNAHLYSSIMNSAYTFSAGARYNGRAYTTAQ